MPNDFPLGRPYNCPVMEEKSRNAVSENDSAEAFFPLCLSLASAWTLWQLKNKQTNNNKNWISLWAQWLGTVHWKAGSHMAGHGLNPIPGDFENTQVHVLICLKSWWEGKMEEGEVWPVWPCPNTEFSLTCSLALSLSGEHMPFSNKKTTAKTKTIQLKGKINLLWMKK